MKCKVVKDYRAALTRNLLQGTVLAEPKTSGTIMNHAGIPNKEVGEYGAYSAAVKSNPHDTHALMNKKIDSMITKLEAEFAATRNSLVEIKDEMRNRYAEMNARIDQVEEKVFSCDKKLESLSLRVYTLLENICTALLDPQGVQKPKWKTYWQDQIKLLTEYRSSVPKAPNNGSC